MLKTVTPPPPPPEDSQPVQLDPTMRMLLQFGKVASPSAVHEALTARARQIQSQYKNAEAFKAEVMFMRILQDGLNFGKWPR